MTATLPVRIAPLTRKYDTSESRLNRTDLTWMRSARSWGQPSFPATLSSNSSDLADDTFTGPPDDVGAEDVAPGSVITFDFQDHPVRNFGGGDFNVYAMDVGTVDFSNIRVEASVDGITFFDVTSTAGPVLSTPDGNPYARSYDLDLPIAQFRFAGDLNIPAGSTVTASGSRGLSLFAENDVIIGANVMFDMSADGQTPGPGGGLAVAEERAARVARATVRLPRTAATGPFRLARIGASSQLDRRQWSEGRWAY